MGLTDLSDPGPSWTKIDILETKAVPDLGVDAYPIYPFQNNK